MCLTSCLTDSHLFKYKYPSHRLKYYSDLPYIRTHRQNKDIWYTLCCYCCLVSKLCPTLLWSHWLLSRLLCPWDFPGKNTRVGCHFLLQGISLIQGSNHASCIGRQILYHWATKEALMYWLELPNYSLVCTNLLAIILKASLNSLRSYFLVYILGIKTLCPAKIFTGKEFGRDKCYVDIQWYHFSLNFIKHYEFWTHEWSCFPLTWMILLSSLLGDVICTSPMPWGLAPTVRPKGFLTPQLEKACTSH